MKARNELVGLEPGPEVGHLPPPAGSAESKRQTDRQRLQFYNCNRFETVRKKESKKESKKIERQRDREKEAERQRQTQRLRRREISNL